MLIRNKKCKFSFVIGSFLLFLFVGLAHAQTTTGQENWVYTYNNPFVDRDDYFNDIRRSSYDGYIYATGRRYRTASLYYDMTLWKIDPAIGDTIWTSTFDPPGTDKYSEGYEIAFDNAGKIYVAGKYEQYGYPYWAFTIVKWDTSGTMLHENRYVQFAWRNNEAYSVDVGPDNAVYVAGYSRGSVNYDSYLVRKYDTALVYKKQYKYIEPGFNMRANRVRVDNNLNVWSCGKVAKISGNVAFFVGLCDTSLTEIGYYKKAGAASSNNDEALDLCLPWSGTGAYACGVVYDGSTQKEQFSVVRLDALCNEVWFWKHENDGADYANGIVSAPSNRVFVAGRITSDGNYDYAVASLSFGLDWFWTYEGSADGDDMALDIDIDNAGNYAYATGYSYETGSNRDIIVSKHSVNDITTWVYKYDGPASRIDESRSIDVSNDGNLYVAGNIALDAAYYEMGAISLSQNLPPTIPELVSPVSYVNSYTVTFTWLASTDPETSVSGYYLAYTTDPTFTTYDSVWSTDTTENIVLAVDTTWYWAVKAKDSNGNLSKFSDIWSFQFDFTDPLAPNPTAPANGGIELDSSVTFTWDPVTFNREVPSPVTYVLQVDTASGFLSPMAIDTTASTTTTLELPLSEYYYYWHVMAYDAAGNDGPYCANQTFMIDLTPPVIDSETVWEETAFCGPFDCFAKVTDMWGIDEVLLYYKRMEDPAWFSDTMTEGSNDWYLSQIPAGTIDNDTIKYYYYAMDNAEYETRVPETGYYWFIANSTGIVEESLETPNVFSFDVGSNLIKGKAIFNLSLPRSASITLEIYDASGRRIATPVTGMRSAGNHTITWTPQANGIYFYSLKSQWENKTGKMLFIR